MFDWVVGGLRFRNRPGLIGRWAKHISVAVACCLILPNCTLIGPLHRQPLVDPEVTSKELLGHIQYLAADEREGRFPGTAGSRAAAEYIAGQWEAAGVGLAAALPGYRQTFDLVTGVSVDDRSSLLIGEADLLLKRDFIPLGFSAQGSFSGKAVYARLGLVDNDTTGGAQDLSGHWLLVFQPSKAAGASYHGSLTVIQQALQAKNAGAVGLIVISPPGADSLVALHYDRTFHDAGLAAVSVTAEVGDNLLAPLGMTAREAWSAIGAGNTGSPVTVPDLEITAEISLKHSTSRIGNVVGFVPGGDPILREQYIVIGAHFDHLGYGGPGSSSLAPRERVVHNGADDNASGVAALIELAEKFSAQRTTLKRSMLFVAFDGEELGLLGSKHFVKHSPVPIDSIVLMINLDMIGRLRDNRLMVAGTGTSPLFERVLLEFNRKYQLDLNMTAEGPGPSDHAAFYAEDIPVLFLFTGAHEDYHKPSDDWQTIDTAGVRIVTELAYDLASYFNRRDERPEFTKAGLAADSPSRRSFKVTFGIMPGYWSTAEGLAVDGVKEGGPAERAGMRKGDVIIAIDGKEVKNIQDYMFRLGELDPGDTVAVQVLRAGDVTNLTLHL